MLALMSGAGAEAVAVLLSEGELVDITDDVGRSSAEAAILYCDASVVEMIIKSSGHHNKDILLSIAEDHPEEDEVIKLIEKYCQN